MVHEIEYKLTSHSIHINSWFQNKSVVYMYLSLVTWGRTVPCSKKSYIQWGSLQCMLRVECRTDYNRRIFYRVHSISMNGAKKRHWYGPSDTCWGQITLTFSLLETMQRGRREKSFSSEDTMHVIDVIITQNFRHIQNLIWHLQAENFSSSIISLKELPMLWSAEAG